MPRKNITIATRDGEETIIADVRGPLALIKQGTGDNTFWSITHVASGLRAIACHTAKPIAMEIMNTARNACLIPWDAEDLPEQAKRGDLADAFEALLRLVERRIEASYGDRYRIRVTGNSISAIPRRRR
jgi:hypothetical protein